MYVLQLCKKAYLRSYRHWPKRRTLAALVKVNWKRGHLACAICPFAFFALTNYITTCIFDTDIWTRLDSSHVLFFD